MKGFPQRYRRWLFVMTVAYTCLLLTATHLPPRHMPNTHVNDKIEHFTAYAILTTLLQLTLWPNRRKPFLVLAMVLVGVLVFGALDEKTQPAFGRDCDIHDWYADTTGATIATLTMLIFYFNFYKAIPAAEPSGD